MSVVPTTVVSKFEFVDVNEFSSPLRVGLLVVIVSSFETNVDGDDSCLEDPKSSNVEILIVEEVMGEELDSINTTVFEFPMIL